LRTIHVESSISASEPQQLNAVTKIQCWKDVVGGKSKGRVYGTANLASNICHGVSSLSQPLFVTAATDYIDHYAENERLRQQVEQAQKTANVAMQKYAQVEDTLRLIRQEMVMMQDRNVRNTLT